VTEIFIHYIQGEAGMKKKLLVLLFAVSMIFVMCGCGGSSDSSAPESAPEETSEPVTGNDLLASYYEFDLDGHSFALPCPLSEIAAAGYYVEEIETGAEMDPKTWTLIYAYTDNSRTQTAFTLNVINIEEEAKTPIGDCLVTSLRVNPSDSCAAAITMKKAGVKIDVTSEDAAKKTADALKSAYGTEEGVFSEENSDGMYLKWRFSNLPDVEKEDTYVMGMEEGTSISEDEFRIEYAGRAQ
jgi:hypothetical protein